MTRPLRIQYEGAFYHVFSRGNERKDIFQTDDDRELFLAALDESSKRFHVILHSYCLMSNHIHLLLETPRANLSKFMKYLLGVYTIRFNRIHKRQGHLFQGRYKAYLVEKDAYLLELSRYIHLNPVKAGLVEESHTYPWSSMKYFLQTKAPHFLERAFILGLFKTPQDYYAFVQEGLSMPKDPMKDLIGGCILGSKEFADQFKHMARDQEGIPQKRQLLDVPLNVLSEVLEYEEKDFQIYSFWKFGKRSQKEIAKVFDKTDSAISHTITRFTRKMGENKILGEKAKAYEEVISCFKN